MKHTNRNEEIQTVPYFQIMETLVVLDGAFRDAIVCYSLDQPEEFESRLSSCLNSIYQNALRCFIQMNAYGPADGWMIDRVSSLLGEIEILIDRFQAGGNVPYDEVKHRLLIIRSHVQYIRWENGCFSSVDAIRLAYRAFLEIRDQRAIGSRNWNQLLGRVIRAQLEWESAFRALMLFGTANRTRYKALHNETTRWLQRMMHSVELRCLTGFRDSHAFLMDLYAPVDQTILHNEAI